MPILVSWWSWCFMGAEPYQVVLIGDHAQLPATVLSKAAQNEGLGLSLFERMDPCQQLRDHSNRIYCRSFNDSVFIYIFILYHFSLLRGYKESIYIYTSINPYTSSCNNCTLHHVCIVQYFARMQALLRIHRYSNFDVGGRDMLGDSITALENDISTRNMFLRMPQNCQRCRAM